MQIFFPELLRKFLWLSRSPLTKTLSLKPKHIPSLKDKEPSLFFCLGYLPQRILTKTRTNVTQMFFLYFELHVIVLFYYYNSRCKFFSFWKSIDRLPQSGPNPIQFFPGFLWRTWPAREKVNFQGMISHLNRRTLSKK